jgi:hypothetical protein
MTVSASPTPILKALSGCGFILVGYSSGELVLTLPLLPLRNDDTITGQYIAEKHGVIYVAANYRLDALGWLAL